MRALAVTLRPPFMEKVKRARYNGMEILSRSNPGFYTYAKQPLFNNQLFTGTLQDPRKANCHHVRQDKPVTISQRSTEGVVLRNVEPWKTFHQHR